MAISVIVFRPGGRQFFYARRVDPVSGRKKTRPTGTSIRRDAERFAGTLSKQLREGTNRAHADDLEGIPRAIRGKSGPSKAARTARKFIAMLNAIERDVSPNLLSAVDADELSRFQEQL